MSKSIKVSLVIFISILGLQAQSQKEIPIEKLINTNQLKPAQIHWYDGGMIETIYRTTTEKGDFWHVTHRDPNPSKENDYDYYQMDGKTLFPLISDNLSTNRHFYTLNFSPNIVNIKYKTKEEDVSYQIPIDSYVAPEGPGLPVFLGSLPLKVGFKSSYKVLDRWSGKSPRLAILKTVKLEVLKEDVLTIANTKHKTFIVNLSSDNGSNSKVWVLKKAPHYWVKVEYTPVSGEVFKSQASQIFIFR